MAASDFFDLRSLLIDVFVFEISWLTILLGISSAYILYYYVIVVDKPKVFAHKESEILPSIEKHCPILFESYWPTFWGFHAHITSIFRARFQGYLSIEYKREVLLLCDGGEVALDWAEPSQDCQDSPVLLVLPGLTGGTDNNYIGHMVADGIELKFRAVVFNQRGNGGIRLKTPKTFCASDTSDLREVILHIRKQCPSSPLMAVGVSLGG
jgi:abhydrolase domain-containing protein 1/3